MPGPKNRVSHGLRYHPVNVYLAAYAAVVLLLATACAPIDQPHDAGLARVSIVYQGESPRVCLVGDFNQWNDTALCQGTEAGLARFSLALPPGRYGYAFLVNGELVPDLQALLLEDDGFGGKNSVLLVP